MYTSSPQSSVFVSRTVNNGFAQHYYYTVNRKSVVVLRHTRFYRRKEVPTISLQWLKKKKLDNELLDMNYRITILDPGTSFPFHWLHGDFYFVYSSKTLVPEDICTLSSSGTKQLFWRDLLWFLLKAL